MSDNAKIQSTSQSASSAPSAERRRLLRAAAVSAPFIATLPTNLAAAVANASTYQCQEKDREASDNLSEGKDAVGENSSDKWVRIWADYVTLTKGEQKRLEYYTGKDPFNGGNDFYYVGDRWDVQNDTSDAKQLGDPITGDYIKNLSDTGWKSSTIIKKKVLAMFLETERDGIITGLEYKGMYPHKQRTDFTAASGSCMCSIDPNSPFCST